MELFQFGRYTLWVGLPSEIIQPPSPQGYLALGQLMREGSLTSEYGLTIRVIRYQDGITGYGIILGQGRPRTPKGDDRETIMLLAREAFEEYDLCTPLTRLALTESIVDTVPHAA